MKILLISDVYFPRVNGVSTSIKTFTAELQALGNTVHLIAPDYGIKTEDEAWIKRIPARNIYFDPEDKLMRYGMVLDMVGELRHEQYDLIHIHTPFVAHYLGLKLGHLLDVPVIETYHTFFEDYLHHYLPWIPKAAAKWMARKISRRQCNQVDAIVAPSKPMLDVLRDYRVSARAEVIPTGLQTQSFDAGDGVAFREQFGIAKDRSVILYLGRVAFEKNIAFLLHMTALLRELHPEVLFVIAGEGPAEASLHKIAEDLNLQQHVKFIGYLDRNTMLNSCYKAADVFVFASKSETQGLVLIEAMAQALPVVAIAELGTKSILIEGQGALIAEEDERQFANRVNSLLDDKQYAKALGQTGLVYVQKHWTSRVQAERMAAFYRSVSR